MRPALRRTLHACSPLVLLPGLWIGWDRLRTLLLVLAIAAFVVEALRINVPSVRATLERWIPVWRPHETTRPSGAAWLALSFAIVARAPVSAALAGVFAAAWADPAASLVGQRFGGGSAKSGAGTMAVGVVAAGAVAVAGYSLPLAVLGGIVAAGVERWAVVPDDNLWLAIGVTFALMSFA